MLSSVRSPRRVGRGEARRADVAEGDGRVVGRRVPLEILGRQRGRAGRLLVDARDGEHRLERLSFAQRSVPAQCAALPVVGRPFAPAVGARHVQVGAQAVAGRGAEDARPPEGAALGVGLEERPGGGGARLHVHHAADGVAPVERRGGALQHLDALGLRDVHLVERVVVEEAGGARGDAVFQEEVDGAGGLGLADGRGVPLAARGAHPHAGDAAHDLARVRRLRVAQLAARDDAHRGRRLPQPPHFARGAHHQRRQHHLLLRQPDVGARGAIGRDVDGARGLRESQSASDERVRAGRDVPDAVAAGRVGDGLAVGAGDADDGAGHGRAGGLHGDGAFHRTLLRAGGMGGDEERYERGDERRAVSGKRTDGMRHGDSPRPKSDSRMTMRRRRPPGGGRVTAGRLVLRRKRESAEGWSQAVREEERNEARRGEARLGEGVVVVGRERQAKLGGGRVGPGVGRHGRASAAARAGAVLRGLPVPGPVIADVGTCGRAVFGVIAVFGVFYGNRVIRICRTARVMRIIRPRRRPNVLDADLPVRVRRSRDPRMVRARMVREHVSRPREQEERRDEHGEETAKRRSVHGRG